MEQFEIILNHTNCSYKKHTHEYTIEQYGGREVTEKGTGF